MKKYLFIILLLSPSFLSSVHAQIISTIAGDPFSGFHYGDGGPATNAGIVHPYGVAVDSRGNVYVSEQTNYVRKIDHNGIITTVAGSRTSLGTGTLGDGGPATDAYLDAITDLAMDAADNLYIVDHGDSRIRKVDKTGIITSVAGGGSTIGDGVPATNAKMDNPNGMTIDPAGNIYVAVGFIVRKINTAGYINTVAGNGIPGYSGDGGAAASARLQGAYDVAINKAGDLFITDQANNTIRKVSTSGIITTIAGSGLTVGSSGDGGPASAALLYVPWGIVVDLNDNILFCDSYNNLVRKIDAATGIINTVAGYVGGSSYSGDGGPATAAQCGSANIAVDCGNNLYLPGSYSHLRKVTYTHSPVFAAVSDTLFTCMSAGPESLDTLLAATDEDMAFSIDWSLDVAPTHGTIAGVIYSGSTTGGPITPAGITYTPNPGYLGIDSFTMMVGFCSQVADWRKVYVKVNPVPVVANVTGDVDTVCRWRTIVLSDATPGGVWSVASTAASATAPGIITAGAYGGTATAQYTVTNSFGCGTTKTFDFRIIECVTEVNNVTNSSSITVYPNPAGQLIHVDGLQADTHYRLLSIVGTVIGGGKLRAGNNAIETADLAAGMYLMEITDPASGMIITKKIVKG